MLSRIGSLDHSSRAHASLSLEIRVIRIAASCGRLMALFLFLGNLNPGFPILLPISEYISLDLATLQRSQNAQNNPENPYKSVFYQCYLNKHLAELSNKSEGDAGGNQAGGRYSNGGSNMGNSPQPANGGAPQGGSYQSNAPAQNRSVGNQMYQQQDRNTQYGQQQGGFAGDGFTNIPEGMASQLPFTA